MNCPICDQKMNEYIHDDIQEEVYQCKFCMFTKTITSILIEISIKNRHFFVYTKNKNRTIRQINKINELINRYRKIKGKNSIIFDPLQKYIKCIAQYNLNGELIKLYKDKYAIMKKYKLRTNVIKLQNAIINHKEYKNSYWKII